MTRVSLGKAMPFRKTILLLALLLPCAIMGAARNAELQGTTIGFLDIREGDSNTKLLFVYVQLVTAL